MELNPIIVSFNHIKILLSFEIHVEYFILHVSQSDTSVVYILQAAIFYSFYKAMNLIFRHYFSEQFFNDVKIHLK